MLQLYEYHWGSERVLHPLLLPDKTLGNVIFIQWRAIQVWQRTTGEKSSACCMKGWLWMVSCCQSRCRATPPAPTNAASGCPRVHLSLAVTPDGLLLLWDTLGILRLSSTSILLCALRGEFMQQPWPWEAHGFSPPQLLASEGTQFSTSEMSAARRRWLNLGKTLENYC